MTDSPTPQVPDIAETASTGCILIYRRPDVARRRELYDLIRRLALNLTVAAEAMELHDARR